MSRTKRGWSLAAPAICFALVSMTFRDDVVDAAGTAVHQWGANTFLWKRMAGAWKLIYVDADHYAAAPPDAAAAGSAS
jgi:hypothetical protein